MLLEKPLPERWEQILQEKFQVYRLLPPEIRKKLGGIIQIFLDEKSFEACGDLEEISDEIRVLVAAQACLLLVGIEKHRYFSRLKSILIYPGAYEDRRRRTFDPALDEGDDVRLGESWHSGSVVLAWDSVLAGAANEDDGQNVVYHEFAHQLDQVNGSADGAPRLPNGGDYAEWARVFSREYEELVEAADHRKRSFLDKYGATNPAEFFAVATEAFFEKPEGLKKEHGELYEQLAGYFGVDPVEWF